MKRTAQSPVFGIVLTALVLAVLLVILTLAGCDEAGAGDDAVPLDLDGTYVGSFEFTDTGDSSKDRANTWEMDVSGTEIALTGHFGDGNHEMTGTIDPNTGALSISWTLTDPAYTFLSSGTIDADGTVAGTGTLDEGSDGTIDSNVTMSGVKNTSGYILQGRMTFPPDDESQAGRPYTVVVDTDGNGDNGGQIAFFSGIAGKASDMSYIVSGIPAGTWNVYGILYMSADRYSEAPQRAPTAGTDYSGGSVGPVSGAYSVTTDRYDLDFNLTIHDE